MRLGLDDSAFLSSLWWLVLFAMLPFGLRTQDDEGT